MVLAVVLAGAGAIAAAGLAPLQRGRTVWELDGDVRVSLRQQKERCRLSVSGKDGQNVLEFVGPADAAEPELLASAAGEIWIRAKERPADGYAHFEPKQRVWRVRDTGALEQIPGPRADMNVVPPSLWAWWW